MKTSIHRIIAKEIVTGFHGKFVHGKTMTFTSWEIEEGNELPLHSHMHEQISYLVEGEFEMIIGDEKHHLVSGDILVIPSNVKHSGKALVNCRIIDVFSPVREDYK